MIRRKKIILFLILFISPAFSLSGQDLLLGPPTGTMDSKSVFSNPAILSFQNSQIALGVKGYHLGFFDESGIGYKQGYFSLLFPRLYGSNFGGGTNIQYFDSPIFSRSQTGTSLSYRVLNNLSIGAHVSLYHLSYNRDNFVGFDFDDPVFDSGYSKFTFNSSAGIYYRPFSDVEFAAGVRNLNEPNLSLLSDDASLKRETFVGASYRLGLLKGIFELVHGEYGFESAIHAELFSSRGYYVRSGTSTNFNSTYLEGQAHVGRGYSINYQFELPINEFSGNSSGTHMFSVVYEFNKIPSLPDKRTLPPSYPSFDREIPQPSLQGDIFLNSQTDHVIYTEKEIIRTIDEETVSIDDLASLSVYDLGNIGSDPGEDIPPYTDITSSTAPIPETVEMSSSISPQYRDAIRFLVSILEDEQFDSLSIKSNKGNEIRAAGLRNELRNQSGRPLTVEQFLLPTSDDSLRFDTPASPALLQTESITEIEPATAKFQTINTHSESVQNWILTIFDQENTVVHEIQSNSTVPEFIEWDWKLQNGELIEPGVYTYQLEWSSQNGDQFQSNTRSLYVQKIHRKITLDLTKDVMKVIDNPDSIDIILKNN